MAAVNPLCVQNLQGSADSPESCRGRCRSQPFATKERYGCGSAACRYTSARQFAPFSENLRRIRGCPRGRQSRRPLQRLLLSPVGADDSVRPQTAPVFTGIYGESVAAQRADVGIGPYMTPANSCCPANFECKAFLPQSFKGSCYQIWCIVTGGAYQTARRVSPCVRNTQK